MLCKLHLIRQMTPSVMITLMVFHVLNTFIILLNSDSMVDLLLSVILAGVTGVSYKQLVVIEKDHSA